MAEIINFETENLDKIVQCFQAGKVLAFPTDTVYGIGVSLKSREAIDKFYQIKKRPLDKPSQILVSDNQMLYEYVDKVSMETQNLIDHFWPGALTLIFNASLAVPRIVTQDGTVGVRMPNYPLLQEVITRLGCPLVAGSANFAGKPVPTSFENIDSKLAKNLDGIISGLILLNKESTVIDVRNSRLKLIREGAISLQDIQTFAAIS